MTNKTFLDYPSASAVSVTDGFLGVIEPTSGSPTSQFVTVQQILDNVISASYAPYDAEYVLSSSNASLINGKVITAGSNVEVDTSGSEVLIHSTATSSGSYAPYEAEYILASSNASLINGKVITAGSNIEIDTSGSQAIVHGTDGGGGLTYSSISPTTANITLTEQYVYGVDCSGLTANRNLVLPAPSAAGKELLVTIVTGDDTYKCVLIGDTGVSINGGTAATAWKYLREAKQTVRFISTSTTNWQAVYIHEGYGTPSCKTQAYKNAGDQSVNTSTWTVVTMDSETVDNCGSWNTTTSTYTVLFSGWYQITFSCALNHGSAQDNKIVSTRITGTLLGVGSSAATIYNNTPGSCQYIDAIGTIQLPLYAGDSFQFELYSGVATTARNTIERIHAEIVKLMD